MDYKRRWCLCCISVLTIIICFTVAMISQSIISKTPIIFYSTASVRVGETDIIIYPQFNTALGLKSYFLNYTQIKSVLETEMDNPSSPRFEMRLFVSKNLKNRVSMKRSTNNTEATLMLLNLQQETEMGIDNDKLEPLEPGEAYMTQEVQAGLGIEEGDVFYAGFYSQELDAAVKDLAKIRGVDTSVEEFVIVLPLKLKKSFSKFGGRLDDDNEDYRAVVLADITTIMDYMKPYIIQQMRN